MGFEEEFREAKHCTSPDVSVRYLGIFPLPVRFECSAGSEEKSDPDAAGIDAWLALVCWTLNKLAGEKEPFPVRRRSKQVGLVVSNLRSRIRRFLSTDEGCFVNPFDAWEDLKKKQVSYEGEEVANPEPLSLRQIEKSVPPVGHGASVELAPLLEGRAQHLILHPDECLLDAEERLPGKNRGRVHIKKGEEIHVWKLLHDRGVVDWVPLADVHRDENGPYLAGMFGVPKSGKFLEDGSPILRVIMNLKNVNRTLRVIRGDIGELPSATTWNQIFLDEGEVLEAAQADMQSAFYLFRMPCQWRKFFCFNQILSGSDLGLPEFSEVVPSCKVLPMGWASSVGLMQMASRQLILNIRPSHGTELRKGALAPRWFVDVCQEATSSKREWWQVYLDNYFAAGKLGGEGVQPDVAALHEKATAAWSSAGVLSAEDKHVFRSKEVIELGVNIQGEVGLIGASAERLGKLAKVTLLLIGCKLPKVRWVQVVLGRWIFALQYRRPAMAILNHSWRYMEKKEDKRRWWPVVQEELRSLLMLLPLLQTDVRCRFSPLVSCSDASEFGGAVAVSQRLTGLGKSLTQRTRLPQTDPLEVEVLVISIFNGIGGAFRGYDLTGVRPVGLIAVEWDRSARRVTRKAWPSVIEVRDVREVDLKMVREWFNRFPRVKEVHVIGGFPCVHLSSARAGRQNLEGEGSNLFWKLKDIIDMAEEVFSPQALVEFLVENVLSMDVSARSEISRVLDVTCGA